MTDLEHCLFPGCQRPTDPPGHGIHHGLWGPCSNYPRHHPFMSARKSTEMVDAKVSRPGSSPTTPAFSRADLTLSSQSAREKAERELDARGSGPALAGTNAGAPPLPNPSPAFSRADTGTEAEP